MADPQNENRIESESLADWEGELPPIGPLGYLLYVLFFFAFLGTLVFFDVVLRLAVPFKMSVKERIATALNRWVVYCLGIVGTKISIDGMRSFPADCSYLIVCNHQSMFDISVLHGIFASNRPKFIAKKELARGIPGVSICLRTEGAALIDRSDPKQAIPVIRALGERLAQENFAIMLFPEGTRARRGKMKPFRGGGFANILDSAPNAEIIPVALDGSWKLAGRKRGPVPLGVQFSVKIGDPIAKNGTTSDIIARTEESVRSLLHDIRSEKGT